MRRGSARILVVAAVSLLSLGAWMPMAGAVRVGAAAHSATARWRLAKTLGPCESRLVAIAATGPRDAWATGFKYCPKIGLLVARWDGRSWKVLAPPRPYGGDKGEAVAALSQQYAWTFADNGNEGVALLWQHGRAHAFGLPSSGMVDMAAAFSASDAWAFGNGDLSTPTPTSFATHWNGRAWLKETVPVVPLDLAAPGPRNIWVVGEPPSQAGGNAPSFALAHWTGRWRTVPFPHLPSGSAFYYASVVAGTSGGAWVLGDVFNSSLNAAYSLVLHWTGSNWTRVRVPFRAQGFGPLAHDGHGGLWLAATPLTCGHCLSTGVDMIHYSSAGTWTKVFVPVPNEGVTIASMRLIPGTRSLWAAGEIGPPETLAAIFKYGP
jgi:hypothetical protein